MSEFHHVSVLLREAVDALNIRPDGMFVDMVFAATPYLLYAGLLSGRQEIIRLYWQPIRPPSALMNRSVPCIAS